MSTSTISSVEFPATSNEDKENVKLTSANTPAMKGRKRTITTLAGDIVDISGSFQPTVDVIDAMRKRIFELEDQLEAEHEAPPAKRARTSAMAPIFDSASTSAGPSAASAKAEEKKKKMHLKKIFDSLKKECKSDTCKFQGSGKTLKVDEVLEPTDFESIFGGKGDLIQPTPTNKPKSIVTIIQFVSECSLRPSASWQEILTAYAIRKNTKSGIEALFGDELKQLKGNRWTIGGGPSFSKSLKLGQCDVEIVRLEVNYSKNSMKATLKFDVRDVGGDDVCYYGGSNRRRGGWGMF